MIDRHRFDDGATEEGFCEEAFRLRLCREATVEVGSGSGIRSASARKSLDEILWEDRLLDRVVGPLSAPRNPWEPAKGLIDVGT